jgi:hypothetical protein
MTNQETLLNKINDILVEQYLEMRPRFIITDATLEKDNLILEAGIVGKVINELSDVGNITEEYPEIVKQLEEIVQPLLPDFSFEGKNIEIKGLVAKREDVKKLLKF